MGRKKTAQADELLAKTIIFRVTEAEYQRLAAYVENGDCHSVAEAARRVLSARKIHLIVLFSITFVPYKLVAKQSTFVVLKASSYF